MEKIKIGDSPKLYEIESILQTSRHVLQIRFHEEVPSQFGDLTIYTAGGIQCACLPGYKTVFRNEGKTVYLSDDGSVYQPPSELGEILPGEPYEPLPQELLAAAQYAKKAEIASACERTIYNGVTVQMENGSYEHFALTEHDQLNLFGKQSQLAAGAAQLEYHADGQLCRYYSATEMQAIIGAAMFHVSYHTTYCNALNMWIAGCQAAEEVQEIFYGADVPEEYRSEVMNAYLVQIAEMAGDESGTEIVE